MYAAGRDGEKGGILFKYGAKGRFFYKMPLRGV
jgi:hypothetical protein